MELYGKGIYILYRELLQFKSSSSFVSIIYPNLVFVRETLNYIPIIKSIEFIETKYLFLLLEIINLKIDSHAKIGHSAIKWNRNRNLLTQSRTIFPSASDCPCQCHYCPLYCEIESSERGCSHIISNCTISHTGNCYNNGLVLNPSMPAFTGYFRWAVTIIVDCNPNRHKDKINMQEHYVFNPLPITTLLDSNKNFFLTSSC